MAGHREDKRDPIALAARAFLEPVAIGVDRGAPEREVALFP